MTAQHHQAQQLGAPPGAPTPGLTPTRPPDGALLTSAYQQQRRTLGNITNAGPQPGGVVVPPVAGGPVVGARLPTPTGPPPTVPTPAPKVPFTQTATAVRVAAALAKSAQGMAAVAAAQATGLTSPQGPSPASRPPPLYSHSSPTLKLPTDLCLLGCVFVIAEYERSAGAAEVAVWRRCIRALGGEVEPAFGPRVTHVLCETRLAPAAAQALRDGRRLVSAFWLNDVALRGQAMAPWQALHLPVPFPADARPLRGRLLSLSGFEGAERARVAQMAEACGARLTRYLSAHNDALVCRRPDGAKYRKAREWGRPVANAQWLSDVLLGTPGAASSPDAPKYQQFNLGNPLRIEVALAPQLLAAWKAPIHVPPEAVERARATPRPAIKRPRLDRPPLPPPPDPDQENAALENVPITNPDPPPPDRRPVVLFSGTKPDDELPKKARQLGCALAVNKRDVTHLVMPKLARTVKLLCALSSCRYIVSERWILDSHAQNTLLDEQPYILEDTDFEKMFSCNVAQILQKSGRQELFKGLVFYVTPSVIPCPSVLTEIIECAGGTVTKRRRAAQRANGKLVVVGAEADKHILVDMHDKVVFNAEYVLSSIMQQELLDLGAEEKSNISV